MSNFNMTRRAALIGAAAALTTPGFARAQTPRISTLDPVRHNISAFKPRHWQDHFDSLGKGCLLADITARAVHYWGADGVTYRLYPSSVPLTEELTKRGYTHIARKKIGPSWTPTPEMRERDPSLPDRLAAGPGNPLGSHAMYLDWPAYLVHGTHDTRKIGRRSSSGCIGLYNQHIKELFSLAQVGTQVRLF